MLKKHGICNNSYKYLGQLWNNNLIKMRNFKIITDKFNLFEYIGLHK